MTERSRVLSAAPSWNSGVVRLQMENEPTQPEPHARLVETSSSSSPPEVHEIELRTNKRRSQLLKGALLGSSRTALNEIRTSAESIPNNNDSIPRAVGSPSSPPSDSSPKTPSDSQLLPSFSPRESPERPAVGLGNETQETSSRNQLVSSSSSSSPQTELTSSETATPLLDTSSEKAQESSHSNEEEEDSMMSPKLTKLMKNPPTNNPPLPPSSALLTPLSSVDPLFATESPRALRFAVDTSKPPAEEENKAKNEAKPTESPPSPSPSSPAPLSKEQHADKRFQELMSSMGETKSSLMKPPTPKNSKKNEKAIRIIGNYQIGDELGRGSYGIVYKGLHTKTGDFVAIKSMSIRKADIDSIAAEIETLRVLDHENMIKYINCLVSEDKKTIHLILEYVENGSLHDILKKFGAFPESLCQCYIAQVVSGLEYLHSHKMIHRDIKGSNILITKSGVCKLADFGTTATIEENSKHYSCVGTPYWMAPEVILQNEIDEMSDIWSLGCMLIELITGSPPYFDLGPMAAMVKISTDPVTPLPENLSEECEDFLRSCLQKNPADRFSAKQLLSHPWINRVASRERSFTVADASETIRNHNVRRDVVQKLDFYKDSLIFGDRFQLNELPSTLVDLKNEAPPEDLMALVQPQIDAFAERQEPREGDEAEMSRIKFENKVLWDTGSEITRQLGTEIYKKKKAIAIAEKFEAKMNVAETERKQAVLQLQKIKQGENPELTALRESNKALLNALHWCTNILTLEQTLIRLYKDTRCVNLRQNSLESWLKIIVTTDSQFPWVSQISPKPWKRMFTILRNNFLIVYNTDTSEVPSHIIPLESVTIHEMLNEEKAEMNKRIQEEMTRQVKIESTIAQWMASPEPAPIVKEEKKKGWKRKSLIATKGKKGGLPRVLPLDFEFRLVHGSNHYLFSCDSNNSMNMWIDACKHYRPWWEDLGPVVVSSSSSSSSSS